MAPSFQTVSHLTTHSLEEISVLVQADHKSAAPFHTVRSEAHATLDDVVRVAADWEWDRSGCEVLSAMAARLAGSLARKEDRTWWLFDVGRVPEQGGKEERQEPPSAEVMALAVGRYRTFILGAARR